MATLGELGQEYLESAAWLSAALQEGRRQLPGLEGSVRAARERELALLEEMLRQVREVGEVVRHYYEPAYCRNRKYVQ